MRTNTRPAWPSRVPILSADEICRGAECDGNGRHCLYGWTKEAFDALPVRQQVWNAIAHEVGTQSIMWFNDNPHNSYKQIADAWNSTMARLGYTEGCKRD